MAKNKMGVGDMSMHADAFMKAEQGLQLDKSGNGSYGVDHDTMMPSIAKAPRAGASGKPQTPAQHMAVKKAAQASVARRRAGKVGGGSSGGFFGGSL